MKLAAFVALALVATGVSAQNIEVTAELFKDGKRIEQYVGSKPAGEAQNYSNLKSNPYRKMPEQRSSKLEAERGSFETGFNMTITPRVNSEGKILYALSASKRDFITFNRIEVQGVEFEEPQVTVSKAPNETATVGQGEAREYRFGGGDLNYVLKVTATALKN